MDVDLALVSALQLRELLQQHSPASPQVQDLAIECKKLLAAGEATLKNRGPDPKLEQACKELSESLNFFSSIVAADEDLAQQGRGKGDGPQQQQRNSAGFSQHRKDKMAARDSSSKSRRQGRSSSFRWRKKDKRKPATEAAAGGQDAMDTLFSDWPQAAFPFEPNPPVAVAAQDTNEPSWGEENVEDLFAPTAAAAAADANVTAAAASHKQGSTSGRTLPRSRHLNSNRQPAAQAANSEGSSSNSQSRSTSTRSSKDSRDSRDRADSQRSKHSVETKRSRRLRRGSGDTATASKAAEAAAAEAAAAEAAANCCCCIRVASVQAYLQAEGIFNGFHLSIELSLPSQNVETLEEGASGWGTVNASSSSSSGGGGGCEVTWQQQVSFLLKAKSSGKSKKSKEKSKGGLGTKEQKLFQALEREGQMRFLIRNEEEGVPVFVGEFSFYSLASGETTSHRVSLLLASQPASCGGTECGFLSFTMAVETGRAAACAAAQAIAVKQKASLLPKPHRPAEGERDAQHPQYPHRRRAAKAEWVSDADFTARCIAAENEKFALQQQINMMQMQMQQQQQALLQHQQQVQMLQAQTQQMNAQLADAYQRLAAYEMQHKQQLQALQQMQQQKDAAATAADVETARLRKQVVQLENLLEDAKEAEKIQQQQARRHRKEAERLERDLRQQEAQQRESDDKAKEQEEAIAELTTLLDNARSRIRSERQRREALMIKLEAAAGAESLLKAKLQESEEAAAEGKRQLLSLTWGLESPPVFAGLPESPRQKQRQQQQQEVPVAAGGRDLFSRSVSDTEAGEKENGFHSRLRPAPIFFSNAAITSWSDARVLRSVLPPKQPAEGGWGDPLMLAMQEGYAAFMHAEARFSGELMGGVLLDSSLAKVEWRCSIHCEGSDRRPRSLPALLSGSVGAAAAFAVSVTSDLSASPVITVALEREVFEGGRVVLNRRPKQRPRLYEVSGQLEVSRPSRDTPILLIDILTSDSLTRSLRLKLPLPAAAFCVPLPLAGEAFAAQWSSLELHEDAVSLDLPPSHLRSAVSLFALGGRLAILPIAEEVHMPSLDAGGPGIMCVHASAAFPTPAEGDARPLETHPSQDSAGLKKLSLSEDRGIPCLAELAVRRNASLAATTPHAHSVARRGRQPSGLLRVRCSNTALRSSALEALLQQLMTPQQLLEAAAANLVTEVAAEPTIAQ